MPLAVTRINYLECVFGSLRYTWQVVSYGAGAGA